MCIAKQNKIEELNRCHKGAHKISKLFNKIHSSVPFSVNIPFDMNDSTIQFVVNRSRHIELFSQAHRTCFTGSLDLPWPVQCTQKLHSLSIYDHRHLRIDIFIGACALISESDIAWHAHKMFYLFCFCFFIVFEFLFSLCSQCNWEKRSLQYCFLRRNLCLYSANHVNA